MVPSFASQGSNKALIIVCKCIYLAKKDFAVLAYRNTNIHDNSNCQKPFMDGVAPVLAKNRKVRVSKERATGDSLYIGFLIITKNGQGRKMLTWKLKPQATEDWQQPSLPLWFRGKDAGRFCKGLCCLAVLWLFRQQSLPGSYTKSPLIACDQRQGVIPATS